MSNWHVQNEAFIWTQVGDEAYLLTRFNQSNSGVYIIDEPNQRYKFSLHTDGRAHGRISAEKHKHEEFKLPPIKDIPAHLMASQWRSIHPDVIRSTALRIPRPATSSNSIFIGDAEDLFEPYCNLVIETLIYDRDKSSEIRARINDGRSFRRHMELRLFKEYELDDHCKVLGVALYIARFNYDASEQAVVTAGEHLVAR